MIFTLYLFENLFQSEIDFKKINFIRQLILTHKNGNSLKILYCTYKLFRSKNNLVQSMNSFKINWHFLFKNIVFIRYLI